MKPEFTTRAIADLDRIREQIAIHRPQAARRVAARIRSAAEWIGEFPYGARAGTIVGTRELIVRGLPYILVYRVDEGRGRILVVRIFHARRNRDRPGS